MELTAAVSLINTNLFQTGHPMHWADLGCGNGLFTKALATLLPAGSSITAIDRDAAALKKVIAGTGGIQLKKIHADFVNDLLPMQQLNGILMANALHFVQHKKSLIEKLDNYLAVTASLLIVEYDTQIPNPWVPYPLTVQEYEQLFREIGYTQFKKINTLPSKFGRSTIAGFWVGR